MFELAHMTDDELITLAASIAREQKARAEPEFQEACRNLSNALKKAYELSLRADKALYIAGHNVDYPDCEIRWMEVISVGEARADSDGINIELYFEDQA